MIDCLSLDCEGVYSAVSIAEEDMLLFDSVVLFLERDNFLLLLGHVDIIYKYPHLLAENFEALSELVLIFGFD